MKGHDRQFVAGQFLLEALNRSEDKRFEPYYKELSDKKTSLLVSRQRPVPDGIKQHMIPAELYKGMKSRVSISENLWTLWIACMP